MDAFPLGAALAATGVSLFSLTWFFTRMVAGKDSSSLENLSSLEGFDIRQNGHPQAILLVQPGGRLAYANPQARDWFNLWEEEPDLERLTHRLRPSEAFLRLCASETKESLTLDGLALDGISFSIPFGRGQARVVTLKKSGPMSDQGSEDRSSPHSSSRALSLLTTLNSTISANLDLNSTLQTVLEAVETLIPCDVSEITLWSEKKESLIPYRFSNSTKEKRCIEQAEQHYFPGQGFSGYLAEHRQPLRLDDVDDFPDVRPVVNRRDIPFHSYIGVPLMMSNDFIGTLELVSFARDAFSASDQELLEMVAGQAAVAIHNALLYQQEQQRSQELAGLANLAQAVTALKEPQELYARLVEGILPLLEVDVLGFFLYDDQRGLMKAQPPFHGLPDSVLDLYIAQVPPASPAEAQLLSQQILVSDHAAEDPQMQALGLHSLAQAASLSYAILVPLSSGGNILGYLQAARGQSGPAFNSDELRLLKIIAGQAAPMIENASLVQQTRRRAQRADTLRRVASLTASSATLDEILKYSLLDLARLLTADIAAVFLVDDFHSILQLHRPSLFGLIPRMIDQMDHLPLGNPDFVETATGSRSQMYFQDSYKETVPSFYTPLVQEMGIRSLFSVPLISREQALGEILLGCFSPDHFSEGDRLSIITSSGQLATAIDQTSLSSRTNTTLRQQVDQLNFLARAGREFNSTPDPEQLAERILAEAQRASKANCGTILIFSDDAEQSLDIRFALPLGECSSEELGPIQQAVLASEETLLISDFDASTGEQGFHEISVENLASYRSHAGVRSALLAPIRLNHAKIPNGRQNSSDRPLGLIQLHSSSPNGFDASARDLVAGIARQAAFAIKNVCQYAKLIETNQQLVRQDQSLSRLMRAIADPENAGSQETLLQSVACAIQDVAPFDQTLFGVYDPETFEVYLQPLVDRRFSLSDRASSISIPWSSLLPCLTPENRIDAAYRIQEGALPANLITSIQGLSQGIAPNGSGQNGETSWLLMPLYDQDQQPASLILGSLPNADQPLEPTMLAELGIYIGQATRIIVSQQKVREQKHRVEEIQASLALAIQNAEESQSHLPHLLHKDLESTLAVQRLWERSRRITAGLEIAEIINRQNSREEVLLSLAQEILLRMDLDIALVAEPSEGGPRLLNVLGTPPTAKSPETLLGQRNPLRHALTSGVLTLVPRLDENQEWKTSPLLKSLEAGAFVCLPIPTSGGVDSALLAVSHRPLLDFSEEETRLYALLGRQASLALFHLQLLEDGQRRMREVNLLMDFSHQLGSLDPSSILQSLVSNAIHVVPSAETALVALGDQQSSLLLPHSAAGYPDVNRILEIALQPDEALLGKTFQEVRAIRIDEVDFPSHYAFSSENLLRYHDATAGRSPLSALVIPITGATHTRPLGVLLLESFSETFAFSDEQQALLMSLAQQTALTLENAHLYQASERRGQQLQALTHVARSITTSLHADELIATLLDQLQMILPYETGTLWLRDKTSGEQGMMVVHAARGFSDNEQRAGLNVSIEDSLLLTEMIATGSAISVPNVQLDSRFPEMMEHEHLSWLGLPLIASGEVIGVIALEKHEAGFYTPEFIQLATTFASQAAVGLQNAALYQESVQRAQELDRRSKSLAMLNRLSFDLSGSLDIAHILDSSLQELQRATHAFSVSALLFDKEGQAILQKELPESSLPLPQALPDTPLFRRLRVSQGIFQSMDLSNESDLKPLEDFLSKHGTRSLLILPLASGSDLHGLLLAHGESRQHFPVAEVELARTIANQAAIAIQNARLFVETRSLTEDLEQRVQTRTQELAVEHERTRTLLRIITELSSSLDLDQVLNQTLQVLNGMVGAERIAVWIARPGERGAQILASIDAGLDTSQPEEVEKSLSGWVIRKREAFLIGDIYSQDSPLIAVAPNKRNFRSALMAPLMIGAEALGGILLFHRETNFFFEEQIELVQAAANQMAVAVNNAELYRLIRDQAADLGAMLRSQQVETSRSRAILEAVADGVLVTDSDRTITLFNASAERILGLDRALVQGKSLEYFTGLFGKAAQSWRETINTWSRDPSSYKAGDTFMEQITLENGDVVSVRLAPVILRNDFLGTVSIFQDITHQVEVDRLKSEFVATVSHELRTPMTSIKGYVEILLMGAAGELSEQQQRFLQVVQANAERLSVLVNDLLDISRIESGKISFTMQPVNLEELADEALSVIAQRAEEDGREVRFEKVLPKALPRVLGDVERLRQIFDNLLDNAYLYNYPGGIITLRMQPKDGMVQVDVKDSGIGIPMEEQPRVFERFFRGESPLVLGVSGTGLGLSIVQNLVSMHSGDIWLESTGIPGEGSTFSFTLPVYKPER